MLLSIPLYFLLSISDFLVELAACFLLFLFLETDRPSVELIVFFSAVWKLKNLVTEEVCLHVSNVGAQRCGGFQLVNGDEVTFIRHPKSENQNDTIGKNVKNCDVIGWLWRDPGWWSITNDGRTGDGSGKNSRIMTEWMNHLVFFVVGWAENSCGVVSSINLEQLLLLSLPRHWAKTNNKSAFRPD